MSNATCVSAGSGVIESVTLSDKGKQSIAADLILFDADLSKIIGVVSLASGDYAPFADNSVATKQGLKIGFKLASGSSLYALRFRIWC